MLNALLTKIKNGQAVKKETVKEPYSKMNMAVLEILKKYNYIESVSTKSNSQKTIEVKLKYKNNKGVIHGVNNLSLPSRQLYVGYRDIRLVKQGFGLLVLSTPKGIMDGKSARKSKLGGQLLFEIW
ncbi:MAG: small subunit ribosomal protein S8 [Parcubacteria group bacterium Athens0714_26]|nr:MAG: small subunit ribosomal protein S8 [Parcubacteria group bacterium Athens1014_26]TSD03279.1 MAG: small subunit ribosomal protein S8 [Parcubacteria group bacterium Athens0714_26]